VQLMQHLMDVARDRGLRVMQGEVMANNREMLKLAEKLGFKAKPSEEDRRLMLISRRL